MDEQEFENGTFTSETVNLLILNELRLMRRDLKAGLVRLETKMDRLDTNKFYLKCLKASHNTTVKKTSDSRPSAHTTPNYINKNRLENRTKQQQQSETNQDEKVDSERQSQTLKEPTLVPCTVQVDMSELPDVISDDYILNYAIDDIDGQVIEYANDVQLSEERAVTKSVFPIREDENGRYQCDLCDNSYTNKGNLRRHYRQHTGDMRYQCDVCERRFFRNEYLIRHMRKHVRNAKELEADYEPFKCASCSKTFADSDNLKRHMRVHTIRKLISCSSCNKKFLKEEVFKQHMLKVHPQDK